MKIACISISRADWNALGMVAMALREKGADVETFVDGRHDAPDMIADDGFVPRPVKFNGTDFIVLCGDRYRTLLTAAEFASTARIPIAHLAGGDITEGSTDDSCRHAITKLAHLHFPTHADAARRIGQMGEESWRVFNHGSASIDRIKATPLLPREEAMRVVGLAADRRFAILNWQPTGINDHKGLIASLIALDGMPDLAVVAVGANDDPGGASVHDLLANYGGPITFRPHLPGPVYLSLLRHAVCLVGNSSSAYYEAPALGCPAVDVGDRQRGRPLSTGVARRPPDAERIADAMRWALGMPRCPSFPAPFGDGHAATRIAETILSVAGQRDRLLRKRFVDHEL